MKITYSRDCYQLSWLPSAQFRSQRNSSRWSPPPENHQLNKYDLCNSLHANNDDNSDMSLLPLPLG